MPYNCKGDLYKIEIVKKLQEMGIDIKSVNALNKLMEKIREHLDNGTFASFRNEYSEKLSRRI